MEKIIQTLQNLLTPVQEKVNLDYNQCRKPVLLIIGSPRSGSTLLLQYFASSGRFSFPTNLLTRFAYAPHVGAHIQELLKNDLHKQNDFESVLGKSDGLLNTNEFYHFWRKFIPKKFPQYIKDDEFKKIDFTILLKELASIENVLAKPFVCKGMMIQYNLEQLTELQKNFFFLNIKRNPEFVMQSILLARKKYYGTVDKWWSVKPKGFEELIKMNVYHQIAGQVYLTEQQIEKGLEKILPNNQITINYETFCENPKSVFQQVLEKYNSIISSDVDHLPNSFNISDKVKISEKEFDALKKAYLDFENGNIKLP